MRKTTLFAAFAAILFVASCFWGSGPATPEDFAELHFQKWVQDNAHDPESYEPISFEYVGQATDNNMPIEEQGLAYVLHKFRMNNALGTKVIAYRVVVIDKNGLPYDIFEPSDESLTRYADFLAGRN